MKMLRLSFATLLAAVVALGGSVAFALENPIVDRSISTLVNPSGVAMLGNDVIADIGQNGHHRSSVATAPPLIHATSHDKALGLNGSAIFGIDLAGYDTSQQLTVHAWSDSGTKNAGVIPVVANVINPSGYHAFDGA